jgi:hypothetical protein
MYQVKIKDFAAVHGGLDALPFEHLLAWLDQLRQAFEEGDSPDCSKQYLKT